MTTALVQKAASPVVETRPRKHMLFKCHTVQCCPNSAGSHSLLAVAFVALDENLKVIDGDMKHIRIKHSEYLVSADELTDTQRIVAHHEKALPESTVRSHFIPFFNTYKKGDDRLVPIAFDLESDLRSLKAFFQPLCSYFDNESGLSIRQLVKWLIIQGKLPAALRDASVEGLAEHFELENKKPGLLKNDTALTYKLLRKLIIL